MKIELSTQIRELVNAYDTYGVAFNQPFKRIAEIPLSYAYDPLSTFSPRLQKFVADVTEVDMYQADFSQRAAALFEDEYRRLSSEHERLWSQKMNEFFGNPDEGASGSDDKTLASAALSTERYCSVLRFEFNQLLYGTLRTKYYEQDRFPGCFPGVGFTDSKEVKIVFPYEILYGPFLTGQYTHLDTQTRAQRTFLKNSLKTDGIELDGEQYNVQGSHAIVLCAKDEHPSVDVRTLCNKIRQNVATSTKMILLDKLQSTLYKQIRSRGDLGAANLFIERIFGQNLQIPKVAAASTTSFNDEELQRPRKLSITFVTAPNVSEIHSIKKVLREKNIDFVWSGQGYQTLTVVQPM